MIYDHPSANRVQSDTKLGYGVGIVIGLCTLVGTVMFALCLSAFSGSTIHATAPRNTTTTLSPSLSPDVSWHLRASSSTWPPTSFPSSRTAPSAALVFKEQFGRARRSTLLGAGVSARSTAGTAAPLPRCRAPESALVLGLARDSAAVRSASPMPVHARAEQASVSRSLQVHDPQLGIGQHAAELVLK